MATLISKEKRVDTWFFFLSSIATKIECFRMKMRKKVVNCLLQLFLDSIHEFHQDSHPPTSPINRGATFITRAQERAMSVLKKNYLLSFCIISFQKSLPFYSSLCCQQLCTQVQLCNQGITFQYNFFFQIQIFVFLCLIFYNKLDRVIY